VAFAPPAVFFSLPIVTATITCALFSVPRSVSRAVTAAAALVLSMSLSVASSA
jgi:hypothetical protein